MQTLGEKDRNELGQGGQAQTNNGPVRLAVSSKRRLTLAFAGLIVFAFLTGWFAFNSRKHKGLARYKAELTARGEILEFDGLIPADISASELARTQFVELANALNQHGVSPGALELMSFVEPGRAQVAWKQASPPWIKGSGDLAASWEEFEAQLAPGRGALTQLRQFLTNPPAHWHSRTAPAKSMIPNFVSLRVGAQWLSGDAITQLRQGNLDGALCDLEGLAACAQVNREDYSIVSQMIRVAVASLGLAASWEALQAPGWSDERLERLQKAWEPVDLIDAIEKGFIAERASGEATWARAHVMGGRVLRMTLLVPGPTNLNLMTFFADYIQFPVYRVAYIDEDELFFLRSMQDSIERIRQVKAGRPWLESADGMSVGADGLSKLGPVRGRFQHWITLSTMPTFTRAVQFSAQNETFRQLTRAAIGIRRYQLKHGALPANLNLLSPEFLPRPTYDPMSGKQLEYTLRPGGSYTLYSVGKDHRDDGGERPFWFKGKPGLWDDLDALWPQP